MTQSDDDTPTLAADFFRRARPMTDVHSADAIKGFRNKGGRPKSDVVKKATSLRLDPRILEAAKNDGPQWQTRINDLLLSLIVTDPVSRVEVLRAPTKEANKAA